MNDRPEFLHPDFEPGEFDRVERQLRQALTREAERIHPHQRLDTILHTAREVGAGDGPSHPTRRWLVPVAAAAAVAVIAGGVWWSQRPDSAPPTPPASSGPSATSPSVTSPAVTGTQTSPPPSSSTSPTGPAATQSVTLPVYFVGPVGGSKPTYRLFREFLRGDVAQPATAEARASAALAMAMNAQPYSNTDGYLQPWSGTRVTSVSVTPSAITVGLSNAGASGFDTETQRIAVQELVWTAQAAVGKGTIPVHFSVADGSTALFGHFPVSKAYNRPPSDQYYTDLAPIWVTTPSRDQVVPASRPVVVTGQAIVFEATVAWQLKSGATVVKSGNTTASIGAPYQGTYSVTLGRLAPGTYSIRVYELSAADGSVAAEKVVSFSVR
jgi:hypothetical protein